MPLVASIPALWTASDLNGDRANPAVADLQMFALQTTKVRSGAAWFWDALNPAPLSQGDMI